MIQRAWRNRVEREGYGKVPCISENCMWQICGPIAGHLQWDCSLDSAAFKILRMGRTLKRSSQGSDSGSEMKCAEWESNGFDTVQYGLIRLLKPSEKSCSVRKEVADFSTSVVSHFLRS